MNDIKHLNEAYQQINEDSDFHVNYGLPVTGGREHWPMLDKTGTRIRVGDRIRFQHCVGRYGQTAVDLAIVKNRHYPLCNIEGARFSFDHNHEVLRGQSTNPDPDHYHDTWVEIVKPSVPVMSMTPR